MKTPKSFKLFNETIIVTKENDLRLRRDAFGETHAGFNEIKIDSQSSEEIQEATFYHELIHIILDRMTESELSRNEKFVHILSQLLNHALNSMEY